MSPSASSGKTFYWASGAVIAALSIGILVLALLVTTSGPRVRQVVVQNLSGDEVANTNQGLTVVFDRPIEGADFENTIDIQPEVEHTVSHRNQQLSISFDQNLLSNTGYVLTVRPDLKDALGGRMEREYSYEFTTAEPSFTYLERNYGSGAVDSVDRIIQKAPLSQESHVLFGAGKIKSFARNANYSAVVLPRADNTDELRVIDLGTSEEKSVDIPSDVRVDNLKFSPAGNQFIFVTRGRLYRYDIDGEQLQPVDASSDEGKLKSALYSPDGQALLYQTLDGEYFLTGAAQTTEPSLLGKYVGSGGFDRTNTKLVVQPIGGDAIYDAQAGELRDLPDIRLGGRISTPTFLHDSDELLYLREPLGAEPGETLQVCTVDADGKVEKQAVDAQASTKLFDEPAVSYDDRYVLIEATFEPQGDDHYLGNPKPKDARLVLYDRSDGKVIESGARGVDPVWNR